MPQSEHGYASRAGDKLHAALAAFQLDIAGFVAADFGSHAGGFVDCLLKHGAAKVYAIEPGYGVLDYRLRKDSRVVVCERENALHFRVPEPCDLVTIDVGWTPQRLILPAARWALKPTGLVITLVKPHYEADKSLLRGGVLAAESLAGVLAAVRETVANQRWQLVQELESPLTGHGGNVESLWLLRPVSAAAP